MTRAFLVMALTAIASMFAREASAACATDGQGPCYRYWTVDAVFVAKVLEKVPLPIPGVEAQPGVIVIGGDARLRVRVAEAFRGVEAGAQMTLFAPDGVCGSVGAEDGGELFIYASRNHAGELWARGCGDSKELEEADADLAYARSVNANGPAALLFGDVTQREDRTGGPSDFSQMAGVRIHVRGVNFEAETKTDEEGNYSLALPGAGKYTVEAIPPPGFANRFGDGPVAFELPDRRACFRETFQLQLNGRMRGRVVNDEGEPVSNVVVRDGAEKRSSKTDATGAFDIGPLEEGIYSLAMITGAREMRFADAGLTRIAAGRVTDIPPVIMPSGIELVTLSITVAGPPGAGDAYLLVTVNGNELGDPIRAGTEAIQFLVEKNLSLELLAVTPTHEAKAVARTSSPLTAVTLTLRPSTSPQ